MATDALLEVDRLTTAFPIEKVLTPAVNDVSFAIAKGETLALVGESGSGKSLTALSIMRLVESPGRVVAGRVLFRGRDLLTLGEREMQRVRGAQIALVLQEPMTALNPVFTIGSQIAETLSVHGIASGRAARARAIELLDAVRVPDPQRRADEYPHQLSGGLRQRALIAAALACKPALLIADEPTTALDVTIQAQILDLLRDLRRDFDLSMLLITHDLGIVAHNADRVAVMYAGRIVETAGVRELFANPRHPYTRGLLASIPGRTPGTRLHAIEGTVPRLGRIPAGCAFAPRCPDRFEPCTRELPALFSGVRCFLHHAEVEDPSTRPSPRPRGEGEKGKEAEASSSRLSPRTQAEDEKGSKPPARLSPHAQAEDQRGSEPQSRLSPQAQEEGRKGSEAGRGDRQVPHLFPLPANGERVG